MAVELAPNIDAIATVRASRAWLRELLDIFLNNAEYAMRSASISRKYVRFATSLVDRQVQISIADNGPGIPLDVLDKLFEERITKEKGSLGAGLGGLHAKVIVSTYGGENPPPHLLAKWH